MQIILNDKKSQQWLNRTAKVLPTPLTKEQKALVIEYHDTGASPKDISRELGLPGRQVSGVIRAYVQNVVRKQSVKPEIEGLQPTQPLVVPEAEKPHIEPTCSLCDKSLDHDRVAIGGKFYHKGCAPEKVPVMVTKRPKPPKSNSEIDDFIINRSMAGNEPIDIANEVNRRFGGAWMPGDVTKRLAELRKS